ncbi:MAG: hypothetical protein ABF649_00755 [Bacillus sp. (in: firmicutes)]
MAKLPTSEDGKLLAQYINEKLSEMKEEIIKEIKESKKETKTK